MRLDISQGELAKGTGLSRPQVNLIASGRKNPSLIAAFKISRFLGVKIEDIFFPTYEELNDGCKRGRRKPRSK
jgi:putative transcriptional regulator